MPTRNRRKYGADLAFMQTKRKGISVDPTAVPPITAQAQERRRTVGVIQDADGKFIIDPASVLLKVTDNQASPIVRIKLGKLGAGTTDYGIEIYDSTGTAVFSASGLGVNTVGNAQMKDNAIDSAELVALAVTEAKVAANAITTTKIVADAVTQAKIAANAVGTTEIAALAVTASEIANLTITDTQIATNAITTSKILANAITASKILANAITASKILASAVTTVKLNALAVTAAKIAANTITAAQIAADTITATEIAASTITATEIATNAITADKILASAVTTVKLNALAVTAAKIAANTITASQIAANTITAAEIVAETITVNEIATGTITADRLNISTLSAITADVGTLTAGSIEANVIIRAEQLIASKIGMGPDSSPSATATVSLVHNRSDSVDSTLFVNAGQFTPGDNNLRFQGLTSRPKLAANAKTGLVFERMTVGSPSYTDLSGSGTVAEGYGLRIYDIITGGPSITIQYGLKIEDISSGGTKYAIYTGTGLVRFGDAVSMGALTATTGTFSQAISATNLTLTGLITAATGKFNSASGAGTVHVLEAGVSRPAVLAEGNDPNRQIGLKHSGAATIAYWGINTSGTVILDIGGSSDVLTITSAGAVSMGALTSAAIRATSGIAHVDGSDNLLARFTNSGGTAGWIQLYSPADTEKVRIAADADSFFMGGNVGIGATPSATRLDVVTTLSGNLAARFINTHATDSFGVIIEAGDDSGNYALSVNDKSSNVLLRVRGDGNVLIGTTTAATGSPRLDVFGGGGAARMAMVMTQSTTNASLKEGYWGVRHYTNAEEPLLVIGGNALSADNVVLFGGGANFNAATKHEFYTAATTTTLGGTLAADITGVGASSLFHVRGDFQIDGDIEVSERTISLSSGANDNFATGTITVQRLHSDSGVANITGFAGGRAGRVLMIYNYGGNTITLNHNNGGSSAANRMILPGSTNIALTQGSGVTLVYDTSVSLWRCVAKAV